MWKLHIVGGKFLCYFPDNWPMWLGIAFQKAVVHGADKELLIIGKAAVKKAMKDGTFEDQLIAWENDVQYILYKTAV